MTLLPLTTLERCKALLDMGETVVNDTTISNLILAVSQAVEDYLDRGLFLEERTEVFDVRTGQIEWQLSAWPVSAIASVKSDTNWTFAAETALESTEYTFDACGLLYIPSAPKAGKQSLQVVYTAGLAADTASLIASFPQLADVAEKQVVEEWRRRDKLSKGGESMQGYSTSWDAVALLPSVTQRLQPLRRLTWL